ncbi:transglycosylase domain-containing protein, partial [Patescibacteria group bacterium]|nr:transglycosylase domain-containing protein [Patescibacteria group bacterium]
MFVWIRSFLIRMGRPIYRIIKLIVGLLMILIKNYELRIKNYKKTKKNKISKRIKKFNNWENCFKRKMKKRKTRRRWKLWRGKEKRLKKRINGEAKKKANWMWIVWLLGSLLMGVFSFGIYIFYKEILIDLPDIEKIYTPPPMSSKIVDRDGSLLYKFYEDENRTWIPLSKIPQTLVWATISIEDKDFYRHSGFSLKGVFQAILYNLRKDQFPPRGGSTITQQVVKNVFLGSEKTWKRKLKEAVLAIALEWKLPKNEILERYFNQVAYGGESYGVQEASLKY